MELELGELLEANFGIIKMFRGHLMVGYLALNQGVGVRIPTPDQKTWTGKSHFANSCDSILMCQAIPHPKPITKLIPSHQNND